MREWRSTLEVTAVAFAARLGVAIWASGRFPATGDGFYYETFARRLAEGHGYTWAWPDGAVTYAAHYPVGYPAILAVFYMLFGAKVSVAMYVNAGLGTLGVTASHRLALGALSSGRALIASLIVALHPALLLYTPAVMTEGATLSLLLIAVALALGEGRPWTRAIAAGLVMGVATLVRPQCLLLAALLGACTLAGVPARDRRPSYVRAGLIVVLAVVTCLPWTVRNCERMNRCALVSVNGGWNLAIGTQTKGGAWEKLDVPEPCKTVWDEAEKDACFEKEARAAIVAHPVAWLKRAPNKLATTFDYFGAGPWYLNASNAEAFPERAKIAFGVLETVVSRALLVAALLSYALSRIGRGRRALSAIGAAFALSPAGWVGYGLLAASIALDPKRSKMALFSAGLIVATMATHAVFFGAGRYGIVVAPFVALLGLGSRATRSVQGSSPPALRQPARDPIV